MEVVRILHPTQFDHDKRRFRSTAFRPSSDGSGISVVLRRCIQDRTGDACAHIAKYYREIAGRPVFFWVFDPSLFPEPCELTQSPSATGDTCHRNLKDITKAQARRAFKSAQEEARPSIWCCRGEAAERVSLDDVERILSESPSPPA
jgi:hypothetical protein